MTERPKVAYALITGFVGLPGGKDVFVTRGEEYDLTDPGKVAIVKARKDVFSTEKPK